MLLIHGNKTVLLREGNDWDVFLNYFFASFFILCFVIGIVLNPLIIVYHSKQKRTWVNYLFLIISSIDQFKLLYSPLMLVPKLLSPLGDEDYFTILSPKSISKIVYFNSMVEFFNSIQIDALVLLNASRFLSVACPFLSSRKKKTVLLTVFVFSLLRWLSSLISVNFFREIFMYNRISDSLSFTHYDGPELYIKGGWDCLFIAIGAIFVALTIHYLKNTEPASSEVSSRNIRRGIIFLAVVTSCNILAIFIGTSFCIALSRRLDKETIVYSTNWDLAHFGVVCVMPLSMSLFNSVSFFIISTSFQDFLKRSARQRRIASIS